MGENLDKKLTELEKNFGLKKASTQQKVVNYPINIYGLDYVLDKGIKITEGGHKIEFYGKESSGKTTFSLLTVKRFQEDGKICVWVVSERFDEEWARTLGVDTDKLLLAHPESVEDAGELILELVGQADLIVLDSVASLIPKAELARSLDEPTRGAQAKAYSEFCRRMYTKMRGKTTTLIFINQIRVKMNVMYGNPEDTPCGKALRFWYDTRVEFKSGAFIEEGTKDKKERIGVEINLYGKKNKLGKPQRKIPVDFYYNGTVDNRKSLFFAGIKYGLINLS